ncbi:HIM-4 protein, partial [Aphelenchoides avenae]
NGQESLPPNAQNALNAKRLLILEAAPVNDGTYQCLVRNTIGESRKSFDVSVLVPPRIAVPLLQEELQVVAGEEQELSCPTDGNPSPSIQWLRNGVPVTDEGHLMLNGNITLEIESPVDGTTRYTCVATNKAGTVSRDFFVQGIQPPKIALPEEDAKKATSVVETFEGNSITLECPVTAPLDSVEIEWHKMGKKITESNKYSISLDHQRLVIVNARRGDDSAFSCHVRNMAGEASRSFEMKVLVPPRIEGEPVDNVELVEGEELDLQCIYDGVPMPLVSWTKDRHTLPEHIQ